MVLATISLTLPMSAAQMVEQALQPRQALKVVLIHGIMTRGGVMGPLRRTLERERYECFAPTLSPIDCHRGVRDLSRKLSARIDQRFGPRAPLILVGFSMGGIIARDYAQNLARPGRVKAAFFIATPHGGSMLASILPDLHGAKDLSYHSHFLEALGKREKIWHQILSVSYWTPLDLAVIPSRSARWPHSENQRVLNPSHITMLLSPYIMKDMRQRLQHLSVGDSAKVPQTRLR